jgi:hypothetical protein
VDAKFSLPKLTAGIAAATAAHTAVASKRLPYTDGVSDRAALVKTISPLVTQALAYVKSNTAWAHRLDAVKDAADKVRGTRPPAAPKPKDPAPDATTRETGDRSYVEIAAALRAFADRLAALAGYAPQDEKIALTALRALATQLDALNLTIPQLAQALADAITDRAEAALGPLGLKAICDGVKTSVKGQYGQSSTHYAAVKGIKW